MSMYAASKSVHSPALNSPLFTLALDTTRSVLATFITASFFCKRDVERP